MVTNLLITGPPGVGKTTLMKRVVERLGTWSVSGFLTEEIREEGSRVGFRVVSLAGNSVVFAHRRFHADPEHRLGRYAVRPDVLASLAVPHLDFAHKHCELLVIDEIAPMEMLSTALKRAIRDGLDSKVPVLATVALKGTGFIKRVKSRPDVRLLHLTLKNRDVLVDEVYRTMVRILDMNRAVASPADSPAGPATGKTRNS